MSLYENYPCRVFNVYFHSHDGPLGTFTSLDAVLKAYPEVIDYWNNYRVEEVWNGEVIRLWRAYVVAVTEWKPL